MNNKRKIPAIIKLLIFTMLTSFIWVAFEVYRALTIAPPPVVSEQILAPISPQLDEAVLDTLQQRVYINDSDIADLDLEKPSSVASPTPLPTDSDSIEVPTEASDEGELVE